MPMPIEDAREFAKTAEQYRNQKGAIKLVKAAQVSLRKSVDRVRHAQSRTDMLLLNKLNEIRRTLE